LGFNNYFKLSLSVREQLIFTRWAMVMYDFEKRLYTDPRQDLNSLWWRPDCGVIFIEFVNR